jgi:hypothetical protein
MKRNLSESNGEDERVLMHIMSGDNGHGKPTLYYHHAHILVDAAVC